MLSSFRKSLQTHCILGGLHQVPAGTVYSHLAWGPTGQLAAACDNSIHFLDPSTGRIIDTVEAAHDAAISSLEWAPALLTAGAFILLGYQLCSTRFALLFCCSKRVGLMSQRLLLLDRSSAVALLCNTVCCGTQGCGLA